MNPELYQKSLPLAVGQSFLSAGVPADTEKRGEPATGKSPSPADRNVCPTHKAQGLWAVLLLLLTVASLPAATLTGTVRAEGKPGTDSKASGGKYESRQFKFVERVNYAEMRDFVVYIEGPVGTNATPPAQPAQVITKRVSQEGAKFYPHILPVMVGTTVEWPNSDTIMHNVFSFSDTKAFDLGLYQSPEVKRVTFDQPGRVDVFCSIHSQMSCIILVLPNPYFATTDDKGRYSLRNVPAGTYKLKAWHERLPSDVKEVAVPETGELKVDFTLGIKNLPKP